MPITRTTGEAVPANSSAGVIEPAADRPTRRKSVRLLLKAVVLAASPAAATLLLGIPGVLMAQDKVFRHASGLEFTYPAGWEVRAEGERVFVSPADLVKDAAGQPLEVCWLAGENAEGIGSVRDPRVAAYLESQLRQWQPKIQRLPGVRTLRTGLGEAAVLAYQVPEAGLKMEAYAVLHDGSAVVMLHAAREDLLAKRQPEMSRLFSSLAQEQAPAAAAEAGIVGAWRRSQYIRTSPGTGGVISSTTYFIFEFAADGSFRFVERDRISGNTADLSVILGRDSGAQVRGGRWRADNGMLLLQWADGTVERLPFSVSASTLRLALSGGKRWVFDRVPVR